MSSSASAAFSSAPPSSSFLASSSRCLASPVAALPSSRPSGLPSAAAGFLAAGGGGGVTSSGGSSSRGAGVAAGAGGGAGGWAGVLLPGARGSFLPEAAGFLAAGVDFVFPGFLADFLGRGEIDPELRPCRGRQRQREERDQEAGRAPRSEWPAGDGTVGAHGVHCTGRFWVGKKKETPSSVKNWFCRSRLAPPPTCQLGTETRYR